MNKDQKLIAEAYTKKVVNEAVESPKETSQEWEVKRHEKERSKWDRRKARWNQWKKDNPGKAKEHAAKKGLKESVDAKAIAALDAGHDAQVVFRKIAASHGLHIALSILEDLIDQNDSPNREIELKHVYNELMKGYKGPGFGPGSRRQPYSAAHFDPVRAIKENVDHSLGSVLSSYYHEGKGLDNDTLHDVIVELEEILNAAKNDPDPASALESLIGKLKVD